MAQFVKKENLTISIGEYTDNNGANKKQWRTIGELVTMIGDDGNPYQFFKLWGAGGVVEGKVFEQQDNNQGGQQSSQGGFQNNQQQQQQSGGFQQGGYNQAKQGSNNQPPF